MKYKITDIYEVKANSEEEAIMKLDNRNHDKDYYQDVKRVVFQKVERIDDNKKQTNTRITKEY